ncbi:MAG: carbohydrate ABC transporter permease [Bacillota bacterium]|jgi:alpha-glucoside transport system permease protein
MAQRMREGKRTGGFKSKYLFSYLWMAPAIILIFFFLVLPTFQTIKLSLHEKISFSEREARELLQSELQNIKGAEVALTDKIQEIAGWEQAIAKIEDQYKVTVAYEDISDTMTVKQTAELLTVTVNTALRQEQSGVGLQRFVGLKNYTRMLEDPEMKLALRNNLYWLVLFTIFVVIAGMLIAVLSDKVSWGKLAKTIIFMPMAISGAAGGVIWYFMYQKDVSTGTINAIINVFNPQFEGIAFLGEARLVTFALIAVGVWMQVGFCTVLFSAALQSVPVSLIEMARIEGANSLQIFFRIELPYIWSTVVLVITQMIMWVLKVFDIVFTMTHGGPFGASEVLANRIYRTDFNLGDFNYGSAMAVILFIAIIPVLILNIRNLSREESIRE